MLFQLFLFFKGLGVLCSIGCMAYLFIGKDASLKRKLLLPLFAVNGALMVGIAYFSQGLTAALLVTAFAVFVSQLFVRNLKICDPCGRIVNDYRGNVPESCPSCHANVPNASVVSVGV